MTLQAKITKRIDVWLKVLFFILTYAYLYYEIFYHNNLNNLISGFKSSDFNFNYLFLVISLMLPNWITEAYKWKYTVKDIEVISLKKSVIAVFSGVAMGIFTPNRSGEIAGRAFILNNGKVWEGVFAGATGAIAQLIITIITGLFSSTFYLYYKIFPGQNVTLFLLITIIITIITAIIWLYYNIKVLSYIAKLNFLKKYEKFSEQIKILQRFNNKELSYILLISLLRYVVFFIQFQLILKAFAIDLSINESLLLVPLCFLAITAIPTIALSEIGVRGSVSVFILGNYGVLTADKNINLLLATTLLWIINIVIPAIIGTFFFNSLNFRTKKELN